jgi:hypothetical protein
MSSQGEGERCGLCNQGRIIKQNREVAFRQRTDKGYVSCKVVVQLGVCTHCAGMSSDATAKAIMDEAVRREYEKLP